jgi:AbrB family looped-hinge helix DNA binding protein
MAVTVSEKGWVVIPAELRKKYNLHPGAEVAVVDYGGVLALVPQPGMPRVRSIPGVPAAFRCGGRRRRMVAPKAPVTPGLSWTTC